MDISVVTIIIVVLLFALMFWLVDKKIANPRTKNFLQVVIVIIALILILNFLGVFDHLGSLHIKN